MSCRNFLSKRWNFGQIAQSWIYRKLHLKVIGCQTNEQLRYGEVGLVDRLVYLFKKVWEEEQIPEDWSKGVIVIVGKKGDTSHCSNNRGITLRSTTSKLLVLQIILLRRLNAGLEHLLRETENKCGFGQNRSCIEQIYSLRCIIHQCIEFNIHLYINFVDFKTAFDSIDRQFIWRSLQHYGLPDKYIRIMKASFSHTICAVRVNGELTDWFTVNSGTGQGDIQGPAVFNFCLNFSANLMEEQKVIIKGVTLLCESSRVEAKHILDTDYADDMALLDNTKEGLQETTDLLILSKYSAYAELKINAGKTKCMAVSKCASQRPYSYCRKDTLDISVEDLPIEQVSNILPISEQL